jgi:hypothetical protein
MIAVAGGAAALAVTLRAQGGPAPIGLQDLLGGGWSHPKHYQPDPKTKEALDKAKLEQEKKAFDKKMAEAQKKWDSAKDMFDKAKQAYEAYEGYQELMQEYEHLTPEDGPFDPKYQPPGTPEIPSSCAGSKTCGQCFEDAQAKLTSVRIRFEKLRVLYGSTKAWIDRALAFGDNMASSVGLGGLAWQTERTKIAASVANLEKSYDNKYAELLATLEEALRAIGACEATHYNNPDWYDRFGFMFYTFMADRYRR